MKKTSLFFIVVLLVGAILYAVTVRGGPSGRLTEAQTADPIPDGMRRYQQTVDNLQEGWAYIRLGDASAREQKYEEAIAAYRKSYEMDPGNGLMSGTLLIQTYEKVGRYDEALMVADDILKNQPLVEIGIKRFEDIRTRLLAAKAQQGSAS